MSPPMPNRTATAMAAKSAPEYVRGVSSNSPMCVPFLFLACRPATHAACVFDTARHLVVPRLSLNQTPLGEFSLFLFPLQGRDSVRSKPAAGPGSGTAGNQIGRAH